MKATLMMRERLVLSEGSFVEVVIWRTPEPVRGSRHDFKYRMVLIVEGNCILRYDNEAGKGDHKHIRDLESPHKFVSLDQLVLDFWADVARLRGSSK